MIEHGLDYSLYVIMGYFFLRGLFRGVVKEVVAVLGVFVAFWVASVYWGLGSEHLRPIFDQAGHRAAVSFILIFVVVYFLISIISIFFDKIVKMVISPVLSSLLGSVVGVIKGILFCAVLLIVAETFLKPDDPLFTSSQWWPHLKPITNQARAWLPTDLRDDLKKVRASTLGGERSGGSKETDRAPGTIVTNLDSVDWNTVKNILATRPNDISPAWRDKLRNISGPEAISQEDLKKFVSDHPTIFSLPAPATPAGARPTAPADQPGQQPAGGTAPSWPQPATE